jgi:hypothetical protein
VPVKRRAAGRARRTLVNNMMLSCLAKGAGEVDGYFTGGFFPYLYA